MAQIAILPGDGIGVEVCREVLKIIDFINKQKSISLNYSIHLLGGAAFDEFETPYPEETHQELASSDSALLGAVGGPKWDNLPAHLRPETGLLQMRERNNLFANLRPARLLNALVDVSTLKAEVILGLDLVIVRELVAGIYFGKPRGMTSRDGKRFAYNTDTYDEHQISRIAKFAFQQARLRNGRVCSVDKANVLEVSQLWRQVVTEVAQDFPDIELSHLYVDNAAMQLIRNPRQFDVVLTSNIFGDILSDCAAMLTGSIGMLPSASLNEKGWGLYEPVHGSAPDIAGQNKVNPIAMILSLALLLRCSLNQPEWAKRIELSVEHVLNLGLRTEDIAASGATVLGTAEMGDAILETLEKRAYET